MNGADVGRARDRSRRHYCQCGGEREQGEFMCRRCSPNGDVPSLSSWRLVGALAYWLANHIRGVSERTGEVQSQILVAGLLNLRTICSATVTT